MRKHEKRSAQTSFSTSFQVLQKYVMTRFQADDKPFYLNDDHWKRYSSSTPEKDRLSLPLELKFKPEISGCSFRFFCTFTLQTCFFSGRDRAGDEKKAKPKDEHQQQKHKEDEDKEEKKKFNNYLCRDWISGNPLAKAGAWKRLFRSCWPKENANEKELLNQLFGPEDEEAEKKPGKAELKFHHAFFPLNSTEKALIAPRNPKTGKVDPGPITYEVVKAESCCEVVIDYLPRRDFNAVEAERVLWNLLRAALAIKTQGAAIGGKSGIWGRIHLTSCSVERGPDVRRSEATEKIKDRRPAR